MNTHLLGIDIQNDFVDSTTTQTLGTELKATLAVPGAEQDTKNVSEMIKRMGNKIEQIHMTVDTHHIIDIAHPKFLIRSNGEHPSPFTIITVEDVETGKWRCPFGNQKFLDYLKALEAGNRYPHCVWPEHCLIGSWGTSIYPELSDTLNEWTKTTSTNVDYVTKGSNPWTEHFSAVQAEVPDPQDPSTMLNTMLINILQEADRVLIAGQALSHCVANTVKDIANNFGDDNIKKLILLEDCSSNVPTFEGLGEDFVKEMIGRGMQVARSTNF